MAISMGAALLGSAVIGAGASAIGASKQSKAAKAAAATSAQAEAENRALQREVYDRNTANLSPWMNQGLAANNAIAQLLGLAPTGAPGTPPIAPQPSAFGGYSYSMDAPAYAPREDLAYNNGAERFMPGFGQFTGAGRSNVSYAFPTGNFSTVAAAPTSAPNAFDAYRASTGYNFRVNEGNRALQAAFGRNLQSGAAMKAALRYGQGIASDEFGNYINLLDNQQKLGFGAGSALAGVGQNFANTVSASNTAAATAAANARLYAGQSQANMWGNIGSSFGQALGTYAMFGR